jgi:Helix-turn-helix domain
MLKAYRYKLEPNKSQRYALARTRDVCRELWWWGGGIDVKIAIRPGAGERNND